MAVSFQGIDNRFAVPDIIAKEALYRLKHHLVMPRLANRTYNDYFEGKVGDTITIKRPYMAKVQQGRIMRKTEMVDKTITLSIDKRYHFALEVVDEDVTLNIEDYGRRYLDAGVEELAYQYDIDGCNELGRSLFFARGGAGNGLTLKDAQQLRAHATEVAIPMTRNSFALLDPMDIAAISEDVFMAPIPNSGANAGGQGLNNPAMLSETIREAYRGKLGGWHVLESVHIPHLETKGYRGAPVVMGDNQTGNSIVTDAWTNTAQVVLKKGQLIQIEDVGEVQPRGDRRATGRLQTFVVTEDVSSSASGVATIPIYPEINDGTVTYTNPSGKNAAGTNDTSVSGSGFQTTTAKAGDNKVIYIVGEGTTAGSGGSAAATASTKDRQYRQGLFFCGDALEYVNVALAKPKSATYAGTERDSETGVTISYLADFDITEASEAERLDIFFGVKTVYPEIGLRFIGESV